MKATRFSDQQVREWCKRHDLEAFPASDMRCAMEDAASLQAESTAEDWIPWAEYPWARWAAKDRNGAIWWYELEPVLLTSSWHPADQISSKGQIRNANISGPWQQSLRRRPEGV